MHQDNSIHEHLSPAATKDARLINITLRCIYTFTLLTEIDFRSS